MNNIEKFGTCKYGFQFFVGFDKIRGKKKNMKMEYHEIIGNDQLDTI